MVQIVIGQFGRGMALHRQGEVISIHADAVVSDFDTIHATAIDGDRDACGAGIQRVFRQFSRSSSGTFDNFASRDAVDGGFRQQAQTGAGAIMHPDASARAIAA